MSRHPGASKREAVEAAIREYLERDANSRVLRLKGGVDVDDLPGELRRDRGERPRRHLDLA
jgi:Arc/MetJ family transcription regulator